METRQTIIIGYWLQSVASTALQKTLRKHFEGVPPSQIVTAAREFSIISRVDVQRAFDQLFATRPGTRLVGVHSQMNHQTVTLAHLLGPGPFGIDMGPLQHDELDIGDAAPVRCLKNALWLSHQDGRPFVILMTPSMTHGSAGGVHVEIAVPAGEPGADLSQEWFRELEIHVAAGKTYRGRVISLESHFDYSGRGGAVKVHRLHRVTRDELILPPKTLALLDRNVGGFVASRDAIKKLRFSTKKGILFYGPPVPARPTRFTIWPRSCRSTPRCS